MRKNLGKIELKRREEEELKNFERASPGTYPLSLWSLYIHVLILSRVHDLFWVFIDSLIHCHDCFISLVET